MSIYEIVKANVTVRQAAKRYGVQVQRNGMCRCPFHNVKFPGACPGFPDFKTSLTKFFLEFGHLL